MSPDQLKDPSDRRYALLLAAEELDTASEMYRQGGTDSSADSTSCRAYELRQLANCELEAVQRLELARNFMAELLDSVETLTGIADVHGAGTLADVFYLHAAIIEGEGAFIDVERSSDRSMILAVLDALPSRDTWKQYVKLDYMSGPTETMKG
jgi:hypothetical protein